MLDLTMFKESADRICVRCRDEESTLTFLKEMMTQYPEKCKYWDGDENKWLNSDDGYIDYFPYLNNRDGDQLCWDNCEYAEENGYKIVEYTDIPGALGLPEDLGDIDLSESDISMLF